MYASCKNDVLSLEVYRYLIHSPVHVRNHENITAMGGHGIVVWCTHIVGQWGHVYVGQVY
jgi:hypothetical protein